MSTIDVSALPTQANQKNFYPTPPLLASKLLSGFNWDMIESVLEPSAGKGDLAMEAVKKLAARQYRYRENLNPKDYDVDCIEIDPNLRAMLKGKGFRVVHDDFFTFDSRKHYHLIVMNPPFDRGAEHMLKAISLLERSGGQIACILNAETLHNPYNRARQALKQKLKELSADIEFVSEAFLYAERPTLVDVALIRLQVPAAAYDSVLLNNLQKAKQAKDAAPGEPTALTPNDFIQAIIDHFNMEVDAGLSLIREYNALKPYIMSGKEKYDSPILELSIRSRRDLSENAYLRLLRRKYWNILFSDPRFTKRMTSNVQQELRDSIDRMMDYDFSFCNIRQLQIDTIQQIGTAVEQTILELFDDWTHKYHWDENSSNIHYYNGWRTNDAFAVKRKVIQPFYLEAWNWSNRFNPTNWEVQQKLCDIEKVFDHLSGRENNHGLLDLALRTAEKEGQNRNISLYYFKISLFKKRTIHIEFTDLDVLHRFNIFAGRKKNWLPPCYGKKAYRDMTEEERAVIDSFEGEESYAHVMEHLDYFLPEGEDELIALPAGDTVFALNA